MREDSVTYSVTSPKRDTAFRSIVVREYDFACAVCGLKFQLHSLIEATAAHIIPKHKNGTDDPRNGISLCRTHHWAFDEGIFGLSDSYEILLSPAVRASNHRRFPLFEMDGQIVNLPNNEYLRPHLDAVKWHRENTLLR